LDSTQQRTGQTKNSPPSVRKNNAAQLYIEGKQLEEKARRMAELARAKGANTTLEEVLEADDVMI